jgi:hypothetical protein
MVAICLPLDQVMLPQDEQMRHLLYLIAAADMCNTNPGYMDKLFDPHQAVLKGCYK